MAGLLLDHFPMMFDDRGHGLFADVTRS